MERRAAAYGLGTGALRRVAAAAMMSLVEATRAIVVGQGYVGLPLAMRAVEVGFDVVGYDVDATASRRWPTVDPSSRTSADDGLQAALATGRYRPPRAASTTSTASTSR